jgi:hypothetical protein
MLNDSRPVETSVRISPGYEHPSLGDVGGWEGAVLRSFAVNGVTYLDLEMTANTLSKIPEADRERFFTSKTVFTRIRIAQNNVSAAGLAEDSSKRFDVISGIQRDWYKEVGVREPDPTQYVADRAGDEGVDVGRREAMQTMVRFGALLFLIMYLIYYYEHDDSNNGSWGRSGGGYYG